MAGVVFCEHCRREKGWRKPSLRTTSDACDICGGWDQLRKRKWNERTQKFDVKMINLKNFEHDDKFLVGTQAEARLQDPLL